MAVEPITVTQHHPIDSRLQSVGSESGSEWPLCSLLLVATWARYQIKRATTSISWPSVSVSSYDSVVYRYTAPMATIASVTFVMTAIGLRLPCM